MKAGQGKNKGSGFEREVGAKLSLWISNGERKDLLCRTVLSGGQFTMTSTGNAGDLMAQHPLAFPFCSKTVVECKFWRTLRLDQFLNRDGELYKALLKVQKEAREVDKIWWLVAKQNHMQTLLFMSSVSKSTPPGKPPLLGCSYHQLFNGTVWMFNFDEFLKVVSPKLWELNL